MTQDLEKLLDQLEKTKVDINGRNYEIPVGQPLLRGLQYLELKGTKIDVTRGPFCWNGDCKSCVCDVESAGELKTDQRICRYRVKGPIKIHKINPNFNFKDEDE